MARVTTGFSEYHPWMLDFERLDAIVKAMDQHAYNVNQRSNDDLEPYYSALWGLYINMRPMMYQPVKDAFDKDFGEIRELLNKFIMQRDMFQEGGFCKELAERLRSMHVCLMEMRQTLGLAFPVSSSKKSNRQRLEEAIVGGS